MSKSYSVENLIINVGGAASASVNLSGWQEIAVHDTSKVYPFGTSVLYRSEVDEHNWYFLTDANISSTLVVDMYTHFMIIPPIREG